jgi:transposase InsO family protein
MVAAPFLGHWMAAVPHTIPTMRTDHGIQFTNRQRDSYAFAPSFDRVGHEHGLAHRLTQVHHPWTNGQVERMHRTLQEATVKP